MRVTLTYSAQLPCGSYDKLLVLAGRTVEVGPADGARLVAAGAATEVSSGASLALPADYASANVFALDCLRNEATRGWPYTLGAAPSGATALLAGG